MKILFGACYIRTCPYSTTDKILNVIQQIKMLEKIIETLRQQSEKQISSPEELVVWKSGTINILARAYGKNSQQEEQVKQIEYRNYSFASISRSGVRSSYKNDNLNGCSFKARELVLSFIEDLERFGLPSRNAQPDKNGMNINVNQYQSVNLSVFMSAIQNELTGKQNNELKEIVNSTLEKEEKREKIVEKLKSFGSNVASNIIASIITNPQITRLF